MIPRYGFHLNGMDASPFPDSWHLLIGHEGTNLYYLQSVSCFPHTQRKANSLAALPSLILMTAERPGYKLEWISTLPLMTFKRCLQVPTLESFSKYSAWQRPQADGSYRLNTQARIKWTGRTRRLVALRNVIHAEKRCQCRAREPRGKKAK